MTRHPDREVHVDIYIALQNVKGFKDLNGGEAYHALMDRLRRIRNYNTGERAYDVHAMLLNAQDYGSPQSRLRYYFVGIRKDLRKKKYSFTEPPRQKKTHIDSFLDLVDEPDDPLRLPKSKGASETYSMP